MKIFNFLKPVPFEKLLDGYLKFSDKELFMSLDFSTGPTGSAASQISIWFRSIDHRNKLSQGEYSTSATIEQLPLTDASKAFLYSVRQIFCNNPDFLTSIEGRNHELDIGLAVAEFLDQYGFMSFIKFKQPQNLALTTATLLRIGIEKFADC